MVVDERCDNGTRTRSDKVELVDPIASRNRSAVSELGTTVGLYLDQLHKNTKWPKIIIAFWITVEVKRTKNMDEVRKSVRKGISLSLRSTFVMTYKYTVTVIFGYCIAW